MRLSRHAWAFAAVAAAALSVPVFVAAGGCTAQVRAQVDRDDIHSNVRQMSFAVDLETPEDCANVQVDFVSTERLFNGEEITSTLRGAVTVRTWKSYKATYEFDKDSEVVDWRFEVARCAVCGGA